MEKTVLSIAGFDPSSGAGLQADLKIFNSLCLHGLTVPTCLTIQNTKCVKEIYKIPIEIIEKQIDVIYDDIRIDIVKVGMLYDEEIIRSIFSKIAKYKFRCVIDPVMSATSGNNLSKEDFLTSFKEFMIPKSYIITPNIDEAIKLTNLEIKNIDDIKSACKRILSLGANNVILKGGHLAGDKAVDVFFDGENFDILKLPRIHKRKTHGSGCAFSSLIAGFLAIGEKPIDAFRKTKYIIWNMINDSYKIGKGSYILNHSTQCIKSIPTLFKTSQHFRVWYDLKCSIDKLFKHVTNDFVAEVGMNFGFALSNARSNLDICGINGRIVKTSNGPFLCGKVDFGYSKHIASIILSAMNFDSQFRSAINIKYSESILSKCERNDLSIGYFNRKDETDNFSSTMEWGTNKVISDLKFVPDIIYDYGGYGKEPMIRIIGRNPSDVLSKIITLLKGC